jgi:hypothetical protein
MPTLLLTARQTDDTQKLWRACIAEKWNVERVHNWRVPQVSPDDVAIYGEPLFAHHVAQTFGLRLLEPAVDWLPRLTAEWRGREVRLMNLADARNIRERAFIKPAEEKCFEARVYSDGSELPTPGPLPETLPVLVQEVVEWTLEFRCFVLDGRVVTASPYWRDGQLAKAEDESWRASDAEMQEAILFCERIAQVPGVSIPSAVVVDVGTIRNRGWAVIECNAAWGSGIYGCDPVEVLRVLRRACVPK